MPGSDTPLLAVRSLSKHYGKVHALRGIDFEVHAGEIFGLIGPNGAGKTTALEIILGLRGADAGTVALQGHVLTAAQPHARENVGSQLQGATLQPKLTPREALALFGAYYPNTDPIAATLTQFGLSEKADAPFDSLSGGQQQRLFLALAFQHQPVLAVLDEPTASLDPHARRELHGLIRAQAAAGRAVVLSTHDLAEAETLCDRVGILHAGELIAVGTPQALVQTSRRLPRVRAVAKQPLDGLRLAELPGVVDVQLQPRGCTLTTQRVNETIAALSAALAGNEIVDLYIERPTLQDVYFESSAGSSATGSAAAGRDESERSPVGDVLSHPSQGRLPAKGRDDRIDVLSHPSRGGLPGRDRHEASKIFRFRGLGRHFLTALRLNIRSPQALIYGYAVPLLFLLAFAGIFRAGDPPLLDQMGQLITITILGGACFGLPTAIVSERERGVWRRYRLLPVGLGSLIVSTLSARLLIVASAVLLQALLAKVMFGTPWPAHPTSALAAVGAVLVSFLGVGLLISALAKDVPAVQALGQCLFLPMIMIGGVGVPLSALPEWAQTVSGFMPGRYAVDVLQRAFAAPDGLKGTAFSFAALMAIGFAAAVVGLKRFRWESQQRIGFSDIPWLAGALAVWALVGGLALGSGKLKPVGNTSSYEAMTDEQVNAITYDDLTGDNELVTRLAPPYTTIEERYRVLPLREQIRRWPPANASNRAQRVRNLLSLAALADVYADLREADIGRLVYEQLREDYSHADLKRILTWIILEPEAGTVVTRAPEFEFTRELRPEIVRQRAEWYAKKYLGRVLGKIEEQGSTSTTGAAR